MYFTIIFFVTLYLICWTITFDIFFKTQLLEYVSGKLFSSTSFVGEIYNLNYYDKKTRNLNKQACGANFEKIEYFVDGNVPIHKYGGGENQHFNSSFNEYPSRPFISKFSRIEMFVNKLAIISVGENKWMESKIKFLSDKIQYYQISKNRSIKDVVDKFEEIQKEREKKWILLISDTTYIFIRNILDLLRELEKKGEKSDEFYWIGFPFKKEQFGVTWVYNSLDARILFNPNLVKVILKLKEFIIYCDSNIFGIDECIGDVLLMNSIYPSNILGFEPDKPINILKYFDRGYGKPNYFRKFGERIFYPPLSFGNMNVEEMELIDIDTRHKIPKVIHQLFLSVANNSNEPCQIPYMDRKITNTCKVSAISNGWKYKYDLICSEKVKKMALKNTIEFMLTMDPRFGSDVARLERLFKDGGVYVDSDVLCLNKMFDNQIKRSYDTKSDVFLVCENERMYPGVLNNAVIGATKNSLSLYFTMKFMIDKNRRIIRTGPGLFSFLKEYLRFPVFAEESRSVYPLHFRDIHIQSKYKNDKEMLKFVEEIKKDDKVIVYHIWGPVLKSKRELFDQIINKYF